VLENWEAMLPKFVKVYPQEYKKAMRKKAAPAILPVQAFPIRQAVHG
jgi:glutamate synthase domain-containing protein 3